MPEITCMKRTSVHMKIMFINKRCSHKVSGFAAPFRVRKLFRTYEERSPGVECDYRGVAKSGSDIVSK